VRKKARRRTTVGLDERLTRQLERAARPADPSGVYEHIIRRRERRRIARKAQSAILALAVATGSIAGAYGLWRVFGLGEVTDPAGPRSGPVGASPSPEAGQLPRDAEDIGVGFLVCGAERIGGIDYMGDGTEGNAWTAWPLVEGKTCGRSLDASHRAEDYSTHLVAADHTGDGVADSWTELPFNCYTVCLPLAATDLDANGTEELIVAQQFSIMNFSFLAVRPDEAGDLRLEPILVAPPGHRPVSIEAGEPLDIDAGGDELWSSSIECEGYPSRPVIVWTWTETPIVPKPGDVRKVSETRIQLQSDGLFHVVGTNDYSMPAEAASPVPNHWELGPQCGVVWSAYEGSPN
jgi:hypothetical protein